MFSGTYTALVTPFRQGRLDETAYTQSIQRQIKGGVDGVVPAGTTGESPTLNPEEHIRSVELAVKVAKGRVKVIAGTGANSTSEAIHLTQLAEKVGADASLQVTPYYNKPSQEGLFQHFRAVAKATKLPIILYSIPGRCGVPIDVGTVLRLQKACPNIVAIKEAGGDVDRISQIRAALGPKFTLLSGDDALILPFMSVGASGVISVASNIIPKEISHLVQAFLKGKPQVALKLHNKFYPVFKALFLETNPVPIKSAMAMLGLVEEEYRLPLVKMKPANRKLLKKALQDSGILD
jgi:4-hydroxy-tetrahydrodipicolinate synthase